MPPLATRIHNRVASKISKSQVRRRLQSYTKLHLACGTNVLSQWANIDILNDPAIIRWNITNGLPARSGSIEYIFSEHFIEHVTHKQASTLLAECCRVLKTGGLLRISTPNLRVLIDQYMLGQTTEWADVHWHPRTPCQMLNEGFRLWGHQFVYDLEELEHLLLQAGFGTITRVLWRESTTPALRNLECRPFHGEIILEATKV